MLAGTTNKFIASKASVGFCASLEVAGLNGRRVSPNIRCVPNPLRW
jgi:hypothetical protein